MSPGSVAGKSELVAGSGPGCDERYIKHCAHTDYVGLIRGGGAT